MNPLPLTLYASGYGEGGVWGQGPIEPTFLPEFVRMCVCRVGGEGECKGEEGVLLGAGKIWKV